MNLFVTIWPAVLSIKQQTFYSTNYLLFILQTILQIFIFQTTLPSKAKNRTQNIHNHKSCFSSQKQIILQAFTLKKLQRFTKITKNKQLASTLEY